MSEPFGPPPPHDQPVQPPPPAVSSLPSELSRLQLAARGLRPIDWLTAVLTGVGAFVVAYLVAVVSLLLTTAFVVAGTSSSGPSGTGSALGDAGTSGLPSISNLATAVTVLFGVPAQLVALGDLGRLSIHGSAQIVSTVSGSIHLGFVPVLVSAAQFLTVIFGVRLFRSRKVDLVQSGILSVVVAAVLASVTLLVGLVLAIRVPDSTGLDLGGVTAVNAMAVIVALVVGSAFALAARPGWLTSLHPRATSLFGVIRVAAVHLGVILVVVAVVAAIYAAIVHPTGGAAYPLLLGNLAVLATALGFLGGASLSESAGSLASTAVDGSAPSGTLTAFSAGSVWLWLVLVLVVITAFAAGLLLAIRRGPGTRSSLDWVSSVVAYALAGLLLLVLGTVVVSVQISGIGGSGSAGVTPWTIAVLAAWGAVIEAVARYVAPRVVPMASPGALRFAHRLVGADSVGVSTRVSVSGQSGHLVGPGQDASEPKPSAAQAGTPLSPRARKVLIRSLVAGGVVLVLVVGGSITASVLRSGVYGPGHAAEAYLEALSKGDASTAGKLSKVDGLHTGMLTDSIFGSATNRISDVATGEATVSGDLATVAVSYRQAGKAHDAVIRLTRTGTTWLVHDSWAVSTSLTGTISVATDASLGDANILVGGKTVGHTSGGNASLSAYPGTYTLSVAGSKYIASSSKKVTVTAGDVLGQSVAFEGKATPRLTADAEKMVNDLISTCAASKSGTLDGSCPFYGPGSDATNVSYTVTAKPRLKVQLSYDGEVEVSGTGGTVRSTYTEDFGDGYTYDGDDSQDLYVDVSLVIQGGKLVLDQQ
jgi:hypothetical protein